MTNKTVQQADKKVTKAMTVFTQAVTEVEQAQELLKKGIEQDSMKQVAIKNQMLTLEAQMIELNVAKEEKGNKMKDNAQLISKLKEFTA